MARAAVFRFSLILQWASIRVIVGGGGPKISSFSHLVNFMFLSSLQKFYCGTSDCELYVSDWLRKRKKPMHSASQEPWACPASLIRLWQRPYSICHVALGNPSPSLQDIFNRGVFSPQLPSLLCWLSACLCAGGALSPNTPSPDEKRQDLNYLIGWVEPVISGPL